MATKRRQYGTGSIYFRQKDQRWCGTIDAGYTAKGTRRRISVSAKTEAECKRKLRDRIHDIESNGVPTISPRTTVKAWSETWLEATQHIIRPSTWANNSSTVRKWVVPTIGHKRLEQLSTGDLKAMNDTMRAAGLASASMRRHQSVLNKMLKDAVIEGYRIHPGLLLIGKTEAGENDREGMNVEQSLAMIQIINGEPDPSRWYGLLLNGLRQGERLGLTWDFIDFDRHIIDVSWQLQELHYKDNANKHLGFRTPDGFTKRHLSGRWHLVRPKTAKGRRVIPMTLPMENALLTWRTHAPESPHGLVWCSVDGSPIEPPNDREEWQRLQAMARVRHPKGRPYLIHETRHSTVTLLKELGAPDAVIEQIVGHTKLVQNYVHVEMLPKTRAAMEQLTNLLALGPRDAIEG